MHKQYSPCTYRLIRKHNKFIAHSKYGHACLQLAHSRLCQVPGNADASVPSQCVVQQGDELNIKENLNGKYNNLLCGARTGRSLLWTWSGVSAPALRTRTWHQICAGQQHSCRYTVQYRVFCFFWMNYSTGLWCCPTLVWHMTENQQSTERK